MFCPSGYHNNPDNAALCCVVRFGGRPACEVSSYKTDQLQPIDSNIRPKESLFISDQISRRRANFGLPQTQPYAGPTLALNAPNGVCAAGKDCTVDHGLASTIAQFKTPVLRDLEDSAPYFHNGSAVTFNDVIEHYIAMSALARAGRIRNAPPRVCSYVHQRGRRQCAGRISQVTHRRLR